MLDLLLDEWQKGASAATLCQLGQSSGRHRWEDAWLTGNIRMHTLRKGCHGEMNRDCFLDY
jgi:hypothetical protein